MPYLIPSNSGDYEVVIGMEVHAQVISQSKLFSGASTSFGAAPNANVSFIDAGFPGMLPVLNKECVHQAVKTGLALNAEINLTSVFARKNYFYPDLPQGYQISQYEQPIVGEGVLQIETSEGVKNIGIERLHLEQDAGKSIHDQHPTKSYVDLNRSGVALMEIVSKPDMQSPEDAAAYLKKLRAILRTIETCDGNMEEGSMRCDVNISVRKPGAALGTRCEIKNVNSIKFVQTAIEYEARRQVDLIEDGGEVEQQTRLFDSATGTTRKMRGKEDAHDYRYFPDPDLLPLVLEQSYVDAIKADLPELPDARAARYRQEYGLKKDDAAIIAFDRDSAAYYEKLAKGRDHKLAANWLLSELFGVLNKENKSIVESPISADALGELIDLIADNTISGRIAKDVFALMLETGKSASTLVEEKGLKQVTDTGAIETVIDEILAANQDKVEQYKAGKDKLFGFFVGQVMKQMQGKANPGVVNEILKGKLG